jgi:hypothetical protein
MRTLILISVAAFAALLLWATSAMAGAPEHPAR